MVPKTIEDLPDEILAEIFSYLNVETLKESCGTLRRWEKSEMRLLIYVSINFKVERNNSYITTNEEQANGDGEQQIGQDFVNNR